MFNTETGKNINLYRTAVFTVCLTIAAASTVFAIPGSSGNTTGSARLADMAEIATAVQDTADSDTDVQDIQDIQNAADIQDTADAQSTAAEKVRARDVILRHLDAEAEEAVESDASAEIEVNSEGEIVEPTVEARPSTAEEINATLPPEIRVLDAEAEAEAEQAEAAQKSEDAYKAYNELISKVREVENIGDDADSRPLRLSMVRQYLKSVDQSVLESVHMDNESLVVKFVNGTTYVYTPAVVGEVELSTTESTTAEADKQIAVNPGTAETGESGADKAALIIGIVLICVLIAAVFYVDGRRMQAMTDGFADTDDEDETADADAGDETADADETADESEDNGTAGETDTEEKEGKTSDTED